MNLQEFKQEFDKHLFLFVDRKIAEYQQIALDEELQSVFNHLRVYMQGGKRLRPYGVYVGFLAADREFSHSEWLVCVALELVHVLALIHDDVIDKAHDRRGVATLHEFMYLNTPSFNRGDKTHMANSQAVLVGDIVFAAAFQALRESQTSQEIQSKVHQLLDEVIIGQMIDVQMMFQNHVSKEKIIRKSKYKTALYTFARPFEVGALLAGVSETVQRDLGLLGEMLGTVYQIQDDYLDMFGSHDILQKEILNDIREGQHTLVTHYFFEQASEDDAKRLRQYMGTDISPEDAKDIIAMFDSYGVREKVSADIYTYFSDIKKTLQKSSVSAETSTAIMNIVYLLEQRMNQYDLTANA